MATSMQSSSTTAPNGTTGGDDAVRSAAAGGKAKMSWKKVGLAARMTAAVPPGTPALTRKPTGTLALLTKRMETRSQLIEEDGSHTFTSEPAGSNKHQRRDDQPVSLQAEAAFLYILGSFVLVGLVAPARIAFSRQANDPQPLFGAVEAILYASDVGFLDLYLTAVRAVRLTIQRKLARSRSRSASRMHSPCARISSHPLQIALQVGVATLLPLICDVIGDVLIFSNAESHHTHSCRAHTFSTRTPPLLPHLPEGPSLRVPLSQHPRKPLWHFRPRSDDDHQFVRSLRRLLCSG